MFTLTPVSMAISDYLYEEETLKTKPSSSKLTSYLDAEKLSTPFWYGKALSDFGLYAGDVVDKKRLDQLLLSNSQSTSAAKNKKTKTIKKAQSRRQVRRQAKKEKEKCAIELGLAVPKPYSSLFALVGNTQKNKLVEGFHEAITFALDEIEKRGVITRRGKAGNHHEKAKGLVCAIFTHLTSRAVDPHLHAHIVAITKKLPRLDGTLGNLEERYFYTMQSEVRAIFTARLAENLRSLGYDTIYKDGSFEIVGIPVEINVQFSKRTQEVTDEKKRLGLTGPNAGNIAARNTRAKKQAHQLEDLYEKWQAEALELGVDVEATQHLHHRCVGLHVSDEELLDFPDLTPEWLSEKLVETRSVFTQQDAYKFAAQTALRSGQSVTIALNAVDALLSSDLVIELSEASRYRPEFTTVEIVSLEHQLIRNAQALRQCTFLNDIDPQTVLKAERHANIRLTDEQRSAVLEVTSNNMLGIINGSAGSGKSTVMKVVKSIYDSKDRRVYGTAIAKAAAKNLQKAAGIESQTMAKTLIDLRNGHSQLVFGDVLVVDEAGQVGLKEADAIFSYAKKIGFKVIMIGEDKQLDAIELGGVMRILSKPEIIGSSRIETIVRQQADWDRRAVMAFRDGNAKLGLSIFKQKNRLSLCYSQSEAIETLIADWREYTSQKNGNSPLVIARTWKDVNVLNKKLRDVLIEREKLGSENIPMTGRVGSRTLPFQLSVGERLRFTKNDNKRGLTNGDTGVVKQIYFDKENAIGLSIQRANGKLVFVNFDEYSDHKNRVFLIPSYAQTIYASQGMTVDSKVFVLNDSGVERSNAYVALSRHRSECHLYVGKDQLQVDTILSGDDALELLSHQYSEDRYNKLAIERLGHECLLTTPDKLEITSCNDELEIA